MKKSLLTVMLASATVAGLSAQQPKEPKFYDNCAIYSISQNGKWAVSSSSDIIRLINIETGAETVPQDETGMNGYMATTINSVSNDGVLVADMDMNGTYATYYDGEWKRLDIGDAVNSNNAANGITPDGSRICGTIGRSALAATDEDITMWVPAVWDRQADGSYGAPTLLPHPDKDFFGRNPVGINSIALTPDGRTIVGQVVDATGFYTCPIVYKQADDGTWSYQLPTESLFNPNHVALPPYPGECSAKLPQYEDFMTDEETAAYEQAVNEYWETMSGEYPEITNFMTADELAAYNAALAEYQTVYDAWAPLYAAYDEAKWQIMSESPKFQSNQFGLSTDGSHLAVTYYYEKESDDPNSWLPYVTVNHVWNINLSNNEITKYEDKELSVCSFAGGYIMATETTDDGCFNGYLLKDGQYLSLYDFLCSKGEMIKEWVDLNMTHEGEAYDWETETVITKSFTATGMPVATDDLRVLASYTESMWGSYMPESYVFDFVVGSAINEVATDKLGVGLDAEGNLLVGADAASVAVYDVAGRCVLNVAAPAATVDCGSLAEGVYVVNVTYTDGTTAATKVAK